MLKPTPPTPPVSLQGLDAEALAARAGAKHMPAYDELAFHPSFTAEEQMYFSESIQYTADKIAYKEFLKQG